MAWQVIVSGRAEKQIAGLPLNVRQRLYYILAEIAGPVRRNWPHYSNLNPGRHHCHIRKGGPCYVAIWEADDRSIKLVEVTSVGTHEKAPY